MAKKPRKAVKSAKKMSARAAKKRESKLAEYRESGFTAITSGLAHVVHGVGPEFTALTKDTYIELEKLFAKRKTHFLKACGSSMAFKYLIVKVPSLGK